MTAVFANLQRISTQNPGMLPKCHAWGTFPSGPPWEVLDTRKHCQMITGVLGNDNSNARYVLMAYRRHGPAGVGPSQRVTIF